MNLYIQLVDQVSGPESRSGLLNKPDSQFLHHHQPFEFVCLTNVKHQDHNTNSAQGAHGHSSFDMFCSALRQWGVY